MIAYPLYLKLLFYLWHEHLERLSHDSKGLPCAPYAETCFISCVIRSLSHRLISFETSISYGGACVIVSGVFC